MSRSGAHPYTRTQNPEPATGTEDWVVWAAWADRVTFEEIEERSGFAERDVIRLMRRTLKPASFRRWRERVSGRSTKHRRRFSRERQRLDDRRVIVAGNSRDQERRTAPGR